MTDTLQPAMYEHCVKVFEAFETGSTVEEFKRPPTFEENEEAGRDLEVVTDSRKVWTGHTTQLFAELGLAIPYYTAVMGHLKRMGCVEQLRRGGGSATSKWILHQEPTQALYESGSDYLTVRPQSAKARLDALERVVREQERKIRLIEQALGMKF